MTPLVGCTAAQPPVPDRMWPYVDAARVSLEQNQDGLFRSRFVFHEVRCRLDGGLVVIFDQRGFFGSDGLAFAISGSPSSDPGSWAGGYAATDPNTNEEIRAFLGKHEVPVSACPLPG
ncbi:MAG TPA: hypothetical protein VH475_02880 [Tepidisphaeraceae bacterium]